MDEAVQNALAQDTLIDIITTGRNTGRSRRTEIWFHFLDGRLFISGSPGSRNWYANLVANPDFVFHLKQSLQRDIPARATPVTDPAQRREIFTRMRSLEGRMGRLNVDAWVEGSPW